MRRLLLFALTAVMTVSAAASQGLRVASYNIRYASKADYSHDDGWNQRKALLCDFLRYEDFDAFGTQETTWPQLQDILAALPDYDYVGVGRDDGDKEGEFSPVFYNRTRFELLDKGHFWLSQTPDVPSKGWDAACIRICSWARLKDLKSGMEFWFFNTHLDHVGKEARREGTKLILSKMQSLAGKDANIVSTGDFNVNQFSEAYSTMLSDSTLKDCMNSAKVSFIPGGTFSNWDAAVYTSSHIDHIFVSASARVDKFAVLPLHYWSGTPAGESKLNDAPSELKAEKLPVHTLSDHYPITAEVNFTEQ